MEHELLKKIKSYNERHGLMYDKVMRTYLIDGEFANLSVTKLTKFNDSVMHIPYLSIYAVIGSNYHTIIEKVLKKEYIDYEKLISNYKKEIEALDMNILNMKEKARKEYEDTKKTYIFKKVDYTNLKLWKSFENKVKRKFKNYTLIGSEITVLDRWKKVVGIVDLLVERKGKIYIFDFKTSKDISLNHLMQINIYKKILKSNYKIDVDVMNLTKIDKTNGRMKDTKVTSISDSIWTHLPKDCWIPPTSFGKFDPMQIEANNNSGLF